MQTIQYSRPMIPAIFKGVSHDDLKWTINYLLSLLEIPEQSQEESTIEVHTEEYSARINKLLSIPKKKLSVNEISNDVRLQNILDRWNEFSLTQMSLLNIIEERAGMSDALHLLQLGEEGKAELVVSILTMANIAYIARKKYTKANLYPVMQTYNNIFITLSMDAAQLDYTITHPSTDFEDVLQYACAKDNKCDIIVTSNTKHYKMSDIPVMTPGEVLL